MMSDRQVNYDWLRVLSAFMVVLIHVNAQFLLPRIEEGILYPEYIIETVINFITRFSVPCFLMLSGAFILNHPQNRNYKMFYKKSFWKIALPYFLICILWLIFWGIRGSAEGEGIRPWLLRCLKGTYGNLWYMPMLIVLYMMTPVLVLLKSELPEKAFRNMGIILLVWAVISQRTSSYVLPYSVGVVFSYLGYFMIGNILYNIPVTSKIHIKFGHCCICIAFLVALTVWYRLQGHHFYQISPYSSFFSPTVVIMSCLIFYLFKHLKFRRDISWLSGKTYYIYLIHTIVLFGFDFLRKGRLLFGNEIITIFIETIIIFMVSLVGAVIYERMLHFLCGSVRK